MTRKRAVRARPRIYPTIEQVRQLRLKMSMTVPPDWEDRNGHVNVQFYLTMYERAEMTLLEDIGVTDDYLQAANLGMFDLENHLNYRAEILSGDQISCYNRILAANTKCFHGMFFVVNDSRDSLACTLEYVTAAVNLGLRRIVLFPPEIALGLKRRLARDQELGWPAPVCGAMSA